MKRYLIAVIMMLVMAVNSICLAAELSSDKMSLEWTTNKVWMVGDELYGVMDCKVREPLNEGELRIFKSYMSGQMSDGWGEGFEQHPIHVEDGDLYVSFWSSDKWWEIMTGEEFFGEQTPHEGAQTMAGPG